MSSNQKVTVLTTNGRRQNVSVTANTTLLQILEQVCQKHNFESNKHGLKHHNKIQDLTLTFRFSGLPNNCLLEMFETEERREEDGDVVLCVQLESGDRFQGEFKSTQTIDFVLNDLCKKELNDMETPIVLYMRQEIYGDAMKSTNLKHLGITSGRAIIRLLNRKPEDLKIQANVYIPPTVKPTEPDDKSDRKSPKKETSGKPTFNVTEIVKSLKKEKEVSNDETAEDKGETESVDDNEKEIKELKSTYTWGETGGRSINEKSGSPESEFENIEIDKDEPVIFEIGERHAVVFSLESAQKIPDEIPDSFFELTTHDLKLLLRDLRREVNENEEAPLLTAKLRELEGSKQVLRKIQQYKHCVIRVQFPDRFVLQGTFRPTESVSDVHNFVQQYLKISNTKFHLFTIPPKNILNPDKTLVEVDCVPTAILHFGVDESDNEEKVESYLKDELYTKLTSADGALLSATKSRNLLPQKSKSEDEDCEETFSTCSPSQGAVPKKPKNEDFKESKAGSSGKSESIPKWFKPIKK